MSMLKFGYFSNLFRRIILNIYLSNKNQNFNNLAEVTLHSKCWRSRGRWRRRKRKWLIVPGRWPALCLDFSGLTGEWWNINNLEKYLVWICFEKNESHQSLMKINITHLQGSQCSRPKNKINTRKISSYLTSIQSSLARRSVQIADRRNRAYWPTFRSSLRSRALPNSNRIARWSTPCNLQQGSQGMRRIFFEFFDDDGFEGKTRRIDILRTSNVQLGFRLFLIHLSGIDIVSKPPYCLNL